MRNNIKRFRKIRKIASTWQDLSRILAKQRTTDVNSVAVESKTAVLEARQQITVIGKFMNVFTTECFRSLKNEDVIKMYDSYQGLYITF